MSEINKEECKACLNGENIKSRCDFIGLKNNNLHYKCKECGKIWLKPSLSSIANSLSEIDKKNAKHALKKRSNQNADLLDLKIINLVRNAKNVKKYGCKR